MDISVVIRKSLIYSIIIGLFTGVYVSIFFLIGQFIQGANLGKTYFFLVPLFIILITVIFQPLKTYAQTQIDRLFFKDRYNYQKTLKSLSQAATTIISLDQLLKLVSLTIVKQLKVEKAAFFLVDQKEQLYSLKEADTYEKINQPETLTTQLLANDPLILHLKKHPTPLVLEELAREIEMSSNTNSERIKQLTLAKKTLEQLGAALCIPLLREDKLIGLFNLGNKLSQDMYTDEDIDLLTTLSNQLAVSIENATLHEEMLLAQKQLLLADKLASLGRIAAGIAHEIKNPLAAVKGMTQAIELNPNDPEFLRDFSEVVPKEIDRLNNLVNNLGRFSKTPKMQFKPANINQLIGENLKLFEHRCKNRNVNVITNLNPLPEINVDPEQITQVITNLILNAIQAMPQGGELAITSQYLNNKVVLEITDNGQGIPEDQVKNIFEPFFTTKDEGTGLGLAITYKIIKDHKGEIEVESKLSQGTKFRITIPHP